MIGVHVKCMYIGGKGVGTGICVNREGSKFSKFQHTHEMDSSKMKHLANRSPGISII